MLRNRNSLLSCAKWVLGHKRFPNWLGALAFVVASPAIRIGLLLDDYLHKASLLAPPQLLMLKRTPFDLFFLLHDQQSLNSGFLPWWASPELRVAFLRPLTGLTHALDFALWRNQPHWMHVHSLLWLVAIVVVAAHLYRRLASPSLAPWVAGLAGLGFALDDAHATSGAWIADRYALVAGVFAIAAILVYDRWRREAWGPGRWLAPLFLGLGLLGGESALAGLAYLFSYAIFIDPTSSRKRLLALAPSALVCVVWVLAYKVLGCGTSHSAVYIDPGRDPLRYFQAVIERAPLLLMGQLGFPPSDLSTAASHQVARGLWLYAVAGLTVFAALLWPLLRRERTVRFWALGMVLSLLPICATFPSDRLLLLPGLGGMALMAIFVANAFGEAGQAPSSAWHRLAQPLAYVLLVIHLVLAPLLYRRMISSLEGLGTMSRRVASTFPADIQIIGQQAIVIHPPTIYFTGLAEVIHALEGKPTPAASLTLASSIYPIEVERADASTLIVRPEGGFLLRPGTGPPGHPLPAITPLRFWQTIDAMYRGADEPFPPQPIMRNGIRIEILQLTGDARPAAVSFRFPSPLEDPHWRWVRWHQGGFAEFQPPPIGQSVRLVSYLE
jgi:hypothetical protein